MLVQKKSKKTKGSSVKRKKTSLRKKNKCRYVALPPTKKRTGEKVNPKEIKLQQGKGSPKTGGMQGGFFWHIFHQDVRVGKVFINYNKDTQKADIQIFINQKSQGKGIGRVAYKIACEESKYPKIYASMRKDNIASIKSAVAAGFQEIPSTCGQIAMLWQKNISFPIKIFEELPEELNNSNYIDLLLFLAKLKPALRVKIIDESTKQKLKTWCVTNHFSFLSNERNYICIALDKETANRLQKADDAYEPHEYELGRLLGYPACCCKNISNVGEKNIDEWEDKFIKNSKFKGEFELINPKGYREGYALISHIPCSSACKHSLYIAKEILSIITYYKDNKHFDKWKYWVK